jgi:hypothetical protein
MTRPHVQATIDDGPRQGETIVLDPGKDNAPPREILLPDGHLGARGPGEDFHRPTGAVSRYRLVDPSGSGDFHYRVVPQEH